MMRRNKLLFAGGGQMVDFIEIRILGGFRAVPTGLRMDFMRAYPALKRGANYHCAYGAGHRAPLGKLPE